MTLKTAPFAYNNYPSPFFSYTLLFFLLLLFFVSPSIMAADFEGSLNSVAITDASSTNTPPSATFTTSQNGNTYTFDASGSSDSDGTISEYQWDFGDGNTGTGETVTHTYDTSSQFPVTLTASDNDGAVTIVQIVAGSSCSDTPTISQQEWDAIAKIGNFNNLFYQGTTYRNNTSPNVCKVDISMRVFNGDVSQKNFLLELYALDSNDNLSSLIAQSNLVSGSQIPTECGNIAFSFDFPVELPQNYAIVISMVEAPDSNNYAAACIKSFSNPFGQGEHGTWNSDTSLKALRTDGTDLAFNLYESK